MTYTPKNANGQATMANSQPVAISSNQTPIETNLPQRLDPLNDRTTSFEKAYTPINITASGQILAAPGRIKGFYVNSTTAGTIMLRNALTATTPVISGTITPAVGYHEFPSELSVGGYASLGGTIDVTFFVRPTPTVSS